MASCSGRKRFAVGNLEDYEVIRCLGNGGYGSVVMARHRVTGKVVAIKRLADPGEGSSEVMREKTFLEACAGNPFVVGFHGVVRAPDSMELQLVMEHVGPCLRDFLGQPVSEAAVGGIMWQLLTGAKKMHALHIVHRDIKPENLLVDGNQHIVKMCDFGLALHMSDEPPYDQVGTRWYMAPEMLLGKSDYDALVDSWSLGCVMAELTNGGVLFPGSNSAGQICSIIDVLGVPDDKTWPWFASTRFATKVLPQLRYRKTRNLLRYKFPETMLSDQGFEVLNGLLAWNPDKRLSASAALKHPWFADLNAPPVMTATKKRNLASALPHKIGPLMPPPSNLHKRCKLQCA